MSTENMELCMEYLKKCRSAKKIIQGFPDMMTMLQTEAATKGLLENELNLLATVINKTTMNSTQRASLIKCLIPAQKMSAKIVEKIGIWLIGYARDIPVAPGVATIHWLIGLLNYGLIDTKVVNVFYDAFFFILVKNQKLESCVSQLIYILTQPQDVSRRQVSRILALQAQYGKPQKHLVALLSLFKSYRPEYVPEKISSTNIKRAWKPIAESLKLDLQSAAQRSSDIQSVLPWQENLTWDPMTGVTTSTKKQKTVIPMVAYIKIGSSIKMNITDDSKSIFQVRTLHELGKHQLSLELPCNSLSLLANKAGLHILTFASTDYQSRFCYNLYNTLQNAFIFEVDQFSYEERDKLLSMTASLSQYMQQEILLVTRFLQNFLPFWNTRDHRESIFILIEWLSVPSYTDTYNNILVPLRTMYESSSVDVKCQILRTLSRMVTNLFIKQGFADCRLQEQPLFLTETQTLELSEILEPLMQFISDLVVSGLYSESNNSFLLSEAISFYEQIARLENRSDLPMWTIAPEVVIYNGFLSRNMATVSRVCGLLLRYREINSKLKQLQCRGLFEAQVKTLDTYAKDIAKGLWYNKTFSSQGDGYLLRTIPKTILTDLKHSCTNLHTSLNIRHHYAVLPYKFSLTDIGTQIDTIEDCISMAGIYYPNVTEFIKIFIE